MTDPTVDIAALLRTLTEQQTALLSAHAESARMQRVLVEQLLGSQVGPAVAAEAAPTVVTASPPTESPPVVAPAPLAEAPAPAGVLSDVDKPAEIVARVTESPA